MDLTIEGGQVLSGEVTPSGSKNSALAVLAASVLFDAPLTLQNMPDLSDVSAVVKILEKLGANINWDKDTRTIQIDNSSLKFQPLTKAEVGDMKGSSMLWGAMLGRFQQTDFEVLPGGCALGARPVDAHFNAFRDLGVELSETSTGVIMDAADAVAKEIWLTEMSPTATANVVMLAVTLPGLTTIIGAASEPSVQDLCNLLNNAGANISGIGSNVLKINGGEKLTSASHKILSDHHEIATFLALGASTGGEIHVHNAMPEHLRCITREFAKFNVDIHYSGDTAIVAGNQIISLGKHAGHTILVRPQPWPGLPVDMLPLFIPLALEAPAGSAMFHNWMYESGLFWTSELLKFGANIIVADPHRVMAIAGNKLRGAKVVAPYIIRATVALIMVALAAEGRSTIISADTLDRGHEGFVENLKKLGAVINRVD